MKIKKYGKEVPRKVIIEQGYCEGSAYEIKRCPRCSHSGSFWDLGKYCNSCGQKLDWN